MPMRLPMALFSHLDPRHLARIIAHDFWLGFYQPF